MNNSIFEKIISNLKNMGYDVQENVNYDGTQFDFIGHTAPLQATKFGKNDYFVAGGQITSPTIDDIREFSSQLFDYSKHNRANKLLPGIFGGYWSLPIILVDSLNDSTRQSLQEDSPPKHYAAFEFPIVIDKSTDSVYYFTGTPAWGAVYFEGLRQLAQEITSI